MPAFMDSNKWYTNKLESVLVNETRKILWDLEIQTYDPTQARTWYMYVG